MTERRSMRRARKRLGCGIRVKTRSYFGMVLNLSAEGLFIQTSAPIDPGTMVQLTLGASADRLDFTLNGCVTRAVQTPLEPAAVVRGGIGVRLIDPPASYLGFVSSLLGTPQAKRRLPPAPIPLDGNFEFRVEMQALAGAEMRTLLVSCKTEAEAAELAETELEEGWKVLSVLHLCPGT